LTIILKEESTMKLANQTTCHTHWLWTTGSCIVGISCFVIVAGLACSDTQSKSSSTPTEASAITIDSHGLHNVRNADLRMIMGKLQALHLDRISDEIEITGDLQRDICDLAAMAESLAADAQLMPLLLRDSTMTDESRRVMGTMSSRLRLEAEELARAANRRDLPAVRNNLQSMLDTCIACHNEFRAPALAFAG
jgi:Cytochrome C'